jgi:2-keto-4-pentenoate hydratase/2-oxohepta-3-ene-1,7-dioic acid hydratase in catechol pathway
MKLLNFYSHCDLHLGIVENAQVFDLSAVRPDSSIFSSVITLIRAGRGAIQNAQEVFNSHAGDASLWRSLDALKFGPLVSPECRIFAVGLNYADHAAENQLSPPESPIFFDKLACTITPHNEFIPTPRCTDQVDYEAEFAVVVGCKAYDVSEEEAGRCIAGYTILNDITARDLQLRDKQWFRSKNCDGFTALGPWLVSASDVPDPNNLEIKLWVNGQLKQHSNTRNLIFKPPALISFLSQTLTLGPGDIISTGTPGGIGYYSKPQIFLREGDVVEVYVEGIGTLKNVIGPKRSA